MRPSGRNHPSWRRGPKIDSTGTTPPFRPDRYHCRSLPPPWMETPAIARRTGPPTATRAIDPMMIRASSMAASNGRIRRRGTTHQPCPRNRKIRACGTHLAPASASTTSKVGALARCAAIATMFLVVRDPLRSVRIHGSLAIRTRGPPCLFRNVVLPLRRPPLVAATSASTFNGAIVPVCTVDFRTVSPQEGTSLPRLTEVLHPAVVIVRVVMNWTARAMWTEGDERPTITMAHRDRERRVTHRGQATPRTAARSTARHRPKQRPGTVTPGPVVRKRASRSRGGTARTGHRADFSTILYVLLPAHAGKCTPRELPNGEGD